MSLARKVSLERVATMFVHLLVFTTFSKIFHISYKFGIRKFKGSFPGVKGKIKK